MKSFTYVVLVLLLSFTACKEPFNPEVVAGNNNFLVVEGCINTGGGFSRISVSRTLNLQESVRFRPEGGAILTIEGEDNSKVEGVSDANGQATLATFNLNPAMKYRLRIRTSDGKVYLSDFVESKLSPAIDKIGWKIENGGMQIYANTHDSANNTRYYAWTYDETYEVISPYPSYIELRNNRLVERDPSINISRCWINGRSSEILIASSAKLSKDQITESPLVFLKGNSAKISERYSINVYQQALTKDAYEYLLNMKKNTEQIGGIFDPQPSEISGNLHCVSDPAEVVIGYISAGSISQKRIFITRNDKPSGVEWTYNQGCRQENTARDSAAHFANGNLFIEEFMDLRGFRVSFAEAHCIDCRLRGSNVKPAFWPN
ncbi:DUF4249 domain-containing protein [Pedobacter sp. SYSU D00535]|uniref:DUF4249 domain-containing protein n=1 Tax=Pedobacter sp. SYSU D00535 TaxID=2810308 RepID=UPI001A968220|nr:DUF4249 domain-containing protein [Pedobacter sp. SYSU D00535]